MPHTPGPWQARENYGRHWVSKGKAQIADVSAIETGVGSGMTDTDAETTAANALLIAAAPDLLAACAGMADRLEEYRRELEVAGMHGEASNIGRIAATLRAAARKAEGK